METINNWKGLFGSSSVRHLVMCVLSPGEVVVAEQNTRNHVKRSRRHGNMCWFMLLFSLLYHCNREECLCERFNAIFVNWIWRLSPSPSPLSLSLSLQVMQAIQVLLDMENVLVISMVLSTLTAKILPHQKLLSLDRLSLSRMMIHSIHLLRQDGVSSLQPILQSLCPHPHHHLLKHPVIKHLMVENVSADLVLEADSVIDVRLTIGVYTKSWWTEIQDVLVSILRMRQETCNIWSGGNWRYRHSIRNLISMTRMWTIRQANRAGMSCCSWELFCRE